MLVAVVVLLAWVGMTEWHDLVWLLAAMILLASAGSAIGAQLVTFVLVTSTISDPAWGSGVFPTAEAYLLAFAAARATLFLMFITTWLLPGRSPVAVQARAAA